MQQIAETNGVYSAQEAEKHILFGLAGEKYGIPILQTQEIIADYELTILPDLPDIFQGVISLRGEAIPVINLRRRFSVNAGERTANTRIIIIEMDPTPVGIEVDSVHRVVNISPDDIEEPPALAYGHKTKFITGVAELEKKKFAILIDMQQILTNPDKMKLQELKKIIELKSSDEPDEDDRPETDEEDKKKKSDSKKKGGSKKTKKAKAETEAEAAPAAESVVDQELAEMGNSAEDAEHRELLAKIAEEARREEEQERKKNLSGKLSGKKDNEN